MLLIRLMLVLLACASGFVVQAPIRSAVASRAAVTTMGPAKDGPFTPIVLAAKVVLGENLLQKLRGKGIALHSQEINKFCAECAFAPPNPVMHALPAVWKPWLQAGSRVPPVACAPCSRCAEEDEPGAHQEGEGCRQRSRFPLVISRGWRDQPGAGFQFHVACTVVGLLPLHRACPPACLLLKLYRSRRYDKFMTTSQGR